MRRPLHEHLQPRGLVSRRAFLQLGGASGLALLGGCAVGRTSSEPSAPGRATAPATCTSAVLGIVAPAPGAVLCSGPLTVLGTSTSGAGAVNWRLTDAGGADLAAGVADQVGTATAPAFVVPLELQPGEYSLTLDAGAGSPVDACRSVTQSLLVVDAAAGLHWRSGASGRSSADGTFAAWRGDPVTVSSTWSDDAGGQLALWPLTGDYADWTGDLDIAIGAIETGENWAAAARGEYDDRWTACLRRLTRLWGDRAGVPYIRFAHEFNGFWYPWTVHPEEVGDFVTAWRRFRALQLQHAPAARLVFAPNSESAGDRLFDWRTAFPGAEYVDVLSTSYFNGRPVITSAPEFWRQALRSDPTGAPFGIQRHLEFAAGVGLPFALSEWGCDGSITDSPDFFRQVFAFCNVHGGPGPGQLAYEVLFNVADAGAPFTVEPTTSMPASASAYQALW
ncbi:hypothetical protein [Goekera deserti]|uniref:GH26 domain-containing protein n=1 Tax=Goekera deserti TaxID=2497753 RepID=A0A7K3WF21_9ACTN|nr:hypothetical protein [Goekera deserti]NDI48587.1 hypothetical protein [Goekera deserti]NEL55034.1 hypothetical protein [Goekera deserti]